MAAAAVTSIGRPKSTTAEAISTPLGWSWCSNTWWTLIIRESEAGNSTLLPVGAAAAGRSGPGTAGVSHPRGSSVTSTDREISCGPVVLAQRILTLVTQVPVGDVELPRGDAHPSSLCGNVIRPIAAFFIRGRLAANCHSVMASAHVVSGFDTSGGDRCC